MFATRYIRLSVHARTVGVPILPRRVYYTVISGSFLAPFCDRQKSVPNTRRHKATRAVSSQHFCVEWRFCTIVGHFEGREFFQFICITFLHFWKLGRAVFPPKLVTLRRWRRKRRSAMVSPTRQCPTRGTSRRSSLIGAFSTSRRRLRSRRRDRLVFFTP